ncbi:MAG: hypothetical protein V4465_00565 [Patescibacteria group bacterium]
MSRKRSPFDLGDWSPFHNSERSFVKPDRKEDSEKEEKEEKPGFFTRMLIRGGIQYISDAAFKAGQNGENPPVLTLSSEEAQEYADRIIDKAYERGRRSVINKTISDIKKNL